RLRGAANFQYPRRRLDRRTRAAAGARLVSERARDAIALSAFRGGGAVQRAGLYRLGGPSLLRVVPVGALPAVPLLSRAAHRSRGLVRTPPGPAFPRQAGS